MSSYMLCFQFVPVPYRRYALLTYEIGMFWLSYMSVSYEPIGLYVFSKISFTKNDFHYLLHFRGDKTQYQVWIAKCAAHFVIQKLTLLNTLVFA